MSGDMIIDPTWRAIQCGNQLLYIDESNQIQGRIDSPSESPAWPALRQFVLVYTNHYESWAIAELVWNSWGELAWCSDGIVGLGWPFPFSDDQQWQPLPSKPEAANA